jgi:predicted histone-like DNA-binding protein
MAINYVRVRRRIAVGQTPGVKFLARCFRSHDVTMDTIAKEISNATTVSYPDVLACLKALEIAVSAHVLNGSAVKFNYLGHFIPSIQAKACDTLEEVDISTIKRAKCRFYPSVAFMKDLAKTQFVLKDLEVKGYQGETPEVIEP